MGLLRNYKIIYGGYAVGGVGDNAYLDNPVTVQVSPRVLRVAFNAVVVGSNQGDLDARIAAIETAFRTRDTTLVLHRADGPITFDPTAQTGFNSVAEIEEKGTTEFGGLAREFSCVVSMQLPADDTLRPAGQQGLIDYQFRVAATVTNVRVIAITGAYTVLPGDTDVKARYEAQINDLVESVKAYVDPDAKWDPQGITWTPDRQLKTLQFSTELMEIIAAESTGLFNTPEIKKHTLSVGVGIATDGYFLPTTAPLQEAVAIYNAHVDKNVTTDLQSVWANIIYPRLVQIIGQRIPGYTVRYLDTVEPEFNETANVIVARITAVIHGGSPVVLSSENVEYQATPGIAIKAINDGVNAFAKEVIPAPASAVRVIRRMVRVLGDETDAYAALEELAQASTTTPSGIAVHLGVLGPDDGVIIGGGRALQPNELPGFGAKGGYWVDTAKPRVFVETEIQGTGINGGVSEEFTTIVEEITSEYVVPPSDGVVSIER